MTRQHRKQFVTKAIAATILLICVLFWAETTRRQALYWYEPSDDYDYRFKSEQSLTVAQADVRSDSVALAVNRPDWVTVALRMRVESTFAGHWFEPCIQVGTGESVLSQCFERGAKGLRYVLIPRDLVPASGAIPLHGQHLIWEPQVTETLYFTAPTKKTKQILVLGPHPDDAEIAAFGFYSSFPSVIVNVTAGNYVDGLYEDIVQSPVEQDSLRAAVRTWDGLVVPQWAGVSPDRVVNLGYLTNSLQAYYLAEVEAAGLPEAFRAHPRRYRQGAVDELLKARTAEPTWDSVVADLAALIETVQPDIVVAPHPALDSAPDHKYTTVALLQALDQIGDVSTTLFLYTNHHVYAEHFPFGPSGSLVTLPPWFGDGQFGGLYSHPLNDQTQIRKLFALEAMHDLRAPPLLLTGGPAGVFWDRVRQGLQSIRKDPFGDYSYFRRAVRPNELFFVYEPARRLGLKQFAYKEVDLEP